MPFHPLEQDQPSVIVCCPTCRQRWAIYLQQLGLPWPCPACGLVSRPRYEGTTGTGSGRQITYGSFEKLLSEPDTAEAILRLVEHLLNLRHDGALGFVDASGHAVELEEVHYRLQSQADWQGVLYNHYMSAVR